MHYIASCLCNLLQSNCERLSLKMVFKNTHDLAAIPSLLVKSTDFAFSHESGLLMCKCVHVCINVCCHVPKILKKTIVESIFSC